jgi:ABC-type lipoprotein release transport system permease subunit
VSPVDPLTFAVVTGTLVLTALAACYVPTRRALGIDPVNTLRG